MRTIFELFIIAISLILLWLLIRERWKVQFRIEPNVDGDEEFGFWYDNGQARKIWKKLFTFKKPK